MIDMKNDKEGRDGGDVALTIVPGKGGAGQGESLGGLDGDIIFELANGAVVLHFKNDGTVLVRGEIVDNNRKIYEAFKSWLDQAVVNR